MNIEKIGEPIRMLASFSGGAVEPLRFRWGSREYKVDAVNARWVDRGQPGAFCKQRKQREHREQAQQDQQDQRDRSSEQPAPQPGPPVGQLVNQQGAYSLHYSVQCGGQTYFIHFESKTVQWWLDETVVP